MAGRQPYSGLMPDWDPDGANVDRLKISGSLLHLVKELHAAFPDHCTPTTDVWFTKHPDDYEQFFDWVKMLGMVVGETSHCALTLSGRQAFRAALHEFPDLATRLMAPEEQLDRTEAARLWFTTLRKHFDILGRRSTP